MQQSSSMTALFLAAVLPAGDLPLSKSNTIIIRDRSNSVRYVVLPPSNITATNRSAVIEPYLGHPIQTTLTATISTNWLPMATNQPEQTRLRASATGTEVGHLQLGGLETNWVAALIFHGRTIHVQLERSPVTHYVTRTNWSPLP